MALCILKFTLNRHLMWLATTLILGCTATPITGLENAAAPKPLVAALGGAQRHSGSRYDTTGEVSISGSGRRLMRSGTSAKSRTTKSRRLFAMDQTPSARSLFQDEEVEKEIPKKILQGHMDKMSKQMASARGVEEEIPIEILQGQMDKMKKQMASAKGATNSLPTLAPTSAPVTAVVNAEYGPTYMFVAVLLIGLLAYMGGYCTSTSPTGEDDGVDAIRRKLDEVRAKAVALRLALEAKEAAEAERNVQTAAGGEDPASNIPETYEELMGELVHKSKFADEMIKNVSSMDEVKAIQAGTARVKEVAQAETQTLFEKVQKFGKEVTTDFVTKIHGALDEPSLAKLHKETGALSEDFKQYIDTTMGGTPDPVATDFLPPPLAIILAGLMARSQIVSILGSADGKIMLHSVLFVILAAILMNDGSRPCKEPNLKLWTAGKCLMCAVTVFLNGSIRSKCAKFIAMDDMEYEEQNFLLPPNTGNALLDAWFSFQRSRSSLLNMLGRLKQLENSRTYAFSHLMTIITFMWDVFAIKICVTDVVEFEYHCSQRNMVKFLEYYVMVAWAISLYLIWKVLLAVLYIFKDTSWCISAVISTTRYYDHEIFYGHPVLMTLVRAFLVQDSTVLLELQKKETKSSIRELEAELQKHQQRIDDERGQLRLLESLHDEAKTQDEAWLNAYYNKLGAAADKHAPVLALATGIVGNLSEEELGQYQEKLGQATASAAEFAEKVKDQAGEAANELSAQATAATAAAAAVGEVQPVPQGMEANGPAKKRMSEAGDSASSAASP